MVKAMLASSCGLTRENVFFLLSPICISFTIALLCFTLSRSMICLHRDSVKHINVCVWVKEELSSGLS